MNDRIKMWTEGVPALLRPRAEQFVRLFDAGSLLAQRVGVK